MPDRDGKGPRGTGRVNRRGSGQCRRDVGRGVAGGRNRSLQSANSSDLLTRRFGTLLGMATAILPIIIKAAKLIGRSGDREMDAIEKPATKAVIVEPPPQLPEAKD